MIRAILSSKKSQTRRLCKPPWGGYEYVNQALGKGIARERVALVKPGDLLWVRETWKAYEREVDGLDGVLFRADRGFQPIKNTPSASMDWCVARRGGCLIAGAPWRSPIHMPRWASRLTLRVTDLRVQRLQEITMEDARDEGVEPWPGDPVPIESWYRGRFRELWDSIHGKGAWARNPWVVAISFEAIKKNVDEVLRG